MFRRIRQAIDDAVRSLERDALEAVRTRDPKWVQPVKIWMEHWEQQDPPFILGATRAEEHSKMQAVRSAPGWARVGLLYEWSGGQCPCCRRPKSQGHRECDWDAQITFSTDLRTQNERDAARREIEEEAQRDHESAATPIFTAARSRR